MCVSFERKVSDKCYFISDNDRCDGIFVGIPRRSVAGIKSHLSGTVDGKGSCEEIEFISETISIFTKYILFNPFAVYIVEGELSQIGMCGFEFGLTIKAIKFSFERIIADGCDRTTQG